MPSLLRTEARDRFDLLTITSYDVTLDLRGEEEFASRTVIELVSRSGDTFLDLKARSLRSIRLDGTALPVERWADERYPLTLEEGEHRLEVDAVMGFRNDGEGLHRAVDPADGRAYLYQMSFMSAAPSVFACFDQPDLKAPYTLHVLAPDDWLVVANAAGGETERGRWDFERTQPLSTYFVSLVAGPYHRIAADDDGPIPLGLLCRASMATALDQDAEELFTLTRQCFAEFHRLFGIPYPFGKYDQAFVPDFNALAMENPGCVTIREGMLFTTRVPRSQRVQRATGVAHEMAHQWFGNLVTPKWWDDLWLNEAFAEYMGNRVTAEVTEFSEALVWAAVSRKNWGLTADSRPSTHPVAGTGALDADGALQDFDGISYAKGHAVLTQLATRLGDDVFLGGVRDHFERHRFGNATMRDLFDSWERAGAGDLDAWAGAWLRTAGVDRIELERRGATGPALVRTPPAADPAMRQHDLGVAVWDGSAWRHTEVVVERPRTPVDVPADAPVVLDPACTAWADLTLDELTAAALPDLMPSMTDPMLRATVWITLHNGVHQARLDPARAVDIVVAGIRHEELDTAVSALGTWTGEDGEGSRNRFHEKLLAVVPDQRSARARLFDAYLDRARTAEPGSGLQLAAVQAAASTAVEAAPLRALLAGDLVPGLEVDTGLRWRVLKRLSSLGATDLDELDKALAEETDAKTELAHAWCRARLPLPESKAWAWQRFTGEVKASNYEIEATGSGMWQAGQDDLLVTYAERYFDDLPATTRVRTGWVVGTAARCFYPMPLNSADVLARTDALLADATLDARLRRELVDAGDELRRRLTCRERYPG